MTMLRIQRRLRLSGALVVLGLLISLATFTWDHPTAFILFAFFGAGITVLGVFRYLWTLFRWYHPRADEKLDRVEEREIEEAEMSRARTAS